MAEGVVAEDGKLSSDAHQQPTLVADTSDPAKPKPLLLIVVGEPLSQAHKEAVVTRIAEELQCWDVTASGCDLATQLAAFSSQTPESKSGVAGENSLIWKSEGMTAEVLINPCVHTVEMKLLEFSKADTGYRYLLYAGHAMAESGSWLLQDGTLSFRSFVALIGTTSGGSGPIDVATYSVGEWSSAGISKCSKRMRLNPEKPATSSSGSESASLSKFASALGAHITVQAVPEILQGTDVIGVVPFNRPTVNIFQGGCGVSALFGVRGFCMLVDTGYPRRTCCWDFVRHMDHIDIVILPHVSESNVLGAKSFAERISVGDVRTAIGQVFINAGHSTGKPVVEEIPTCDSSTGNMTSMLVSLSEVSVTIADCLTKSQILRAPCATKIPPQVINLYHKIGFGSLDLHVLNPLADSKEFKEFLANWGKPTKSRSSRLNDLVSISTVVVFRPETRGDHPVRILFPGSSPVTKLYEGLDRLKSNPLFQTLEGVPPERPPPQKSGGDKGSARPGAGPSKPTAARPASSSSSHETTAPKTSTKVASKAVPPTTGGESKKTSAEPRGAKPRDVKTPRDGKSEGKGDAANAKDKSQPVTSTPKKETQKPAVPKNGASAAKRVAGPPPKKSQAKPATEPVAQKAESPERKTEKPAENKTEVAAGGECAVKGAESTLDSTSEVIPELVPCTTEQAVPPSSAPDSVSPGVESTGVTVQPSGSASVDVTLDDGGTSTTVESVSPPDTTASQNVEPGPQTDPTQSWDPPQGLPAPSNDKPVGSMSSTDVGSDKRGGSAAKSAPRDRAAVGTAKRPATADRPAGSARSTGSAASTARKGAPSRPTTPFYVDLAYIPTYAVDGCDAEFFRRVRARYYVIPGSAADPHLLSMLADAKSAWDGEVTVIPTGNTDRLISWMMAHRDELTSLKIEVSPSVARSTLQLDRGSTCSAYRLEF